jgi:hypothetical protein
MINILARVFVPIYHSAKLSKFDFGICRSPGPGLGNLMFPLARAIIGSQGADNILISPTWTQVKIGPFLRREKDKRIYLKEFFGRNLLEWKNWFRAIFLPKVDESRLACDLSHGDNYVVSYEGMGNYFRDIYDGRDLIKAWIDQNAQKNGEILQLYNIACHVRLGDFGSEEDPESKSGHVVRQSWAWYRNAINKAVKLSNISHPKIYLFTDESYDAVVEQLDLPYEMIEDPSRNAITAVINMSRANIIVTSRSTFSQWAAFMSEGLAIWNRNFNLKETFPVRADQDIFL